MTFGLTKQINGQGQWILLALFLFSSHYGFSQDTLVNSNKIRLGFGPSYTGWNAELAYTRLSQRMQFELAGKYVFGGTINGQDGNTGIDVSGFYDIIRSKKVAAYLGPRIGMLWVEAKGLPENNLYLECYFMIGIRHRSIHRMHIGYELGYGGAASLLYDRYSQGRKQEWQQASTLKIYLSYPF